MRAVGNNFNSATNIFRIFNYALTFLIRPKQLQKIENGIKRAREGILPGAHLAAQMPTTVRPSPPGAPPPVAFLLVPVGRGGTPRRRRALHATRLPACVAWPPRRLASSPRRRPDPWTPSLSPSPSFPSSVSLSHARPNAAAAVRHSRSRSHPRASPTRPRAPPRPSLPPHRAARRRKPLDVASTAVPLVGHRRSSPSICCLRCLPELAVCSNRLLVSSSSLPLTPCT